MTETEEVLAEEWIEIEGKSKEDALERACIALNTTKAYLGYEILDSSKGTKIRARKVEEPVENEETVKDEQEVDPQEMDPEVGKKAKEFLEQTLRFIDDNVSVEAMESPEEIVLDIQADGSGIFIGKHGQTLEALQHLIAKMVGLDRSATKRLIVDSEQYRTRRKETLESLAHRLASRARRERRPVSVEPMSAMDRRTLHLALQNDRSVVTKSVGDGENRKVVVIPRKTQRNRNGRSSFSRRGERRGGNSERRSSGRPGRRGSSRRSSLTPSRLHDSFDVPPVPNMDIFPEDVDRLAEASEFDEETPSPPSSKSSFAEEE